MLFRLHLTRNLRTLGLLIIVLAVSGVIGTLWWANHIGLPAPWRAAIESAATKQGVHLKIGSLRYAIFRGIVATDVQFFSDPEHQIEVSRIERVALEVDNTKLASGLVQLKKLELHKAKLLLQVEPTNPYSETLHVTDVKGTVIMPGNQRLEVRNARGRIAGIQVALDARLIGFKQDGKQKPADPNVGKRREALAKLIRELEKWTFDKESPPLIKISAYGDVNDWLSIIAKVGLRSKEMAKNGHQLRDIVAEADLDGDLLTVTSLRAKDSNGTFEGLIDYNLRDRDGRFDISSSLELPRLLKSWLEIPALKDVVISGKQTVRVEGDFHLDEADKPQLQLTGHALCQKIKLRGMAFDALEGAFSWRNGKFFMRDVRLARPDGEAKGKALVEWPIVRIDLHTTLPVPVYRPFFVGQPLEKVLNDFSERKGAAVDLTLNGSFNLTDKYDWKYKGHGAVKNLNYKGVPVNSAECKLALNHDELDFFDGTVVFNYSDYVLHKTFKGANEGTAKIARIRYDAPTKKVHVEDVRGEIWAAPMVRFFAANIADDLEQYRFHQPPAMKASGVVDVTPQGRTALDISFTSPHSADYVFLEENVTLGSPSGKVSIRGEKVTVSDLKVEAFDGTVAGQINYVGAKKITGELNWTDLSLTALASTYDFKMKGAGKATGRIEFSITSGKVSTMSGKGLLALKDAELFSVPMFGPLTPLVSGVLNDERAGSQRAKSAFFTFKIADGILSSNDFQTSTASLNFIGSGAVDMNDRTLDMTMRMNARGLLGLLTLPLRPLGGLFQFRGTGPLKDTRWENVSFSPPSDSEKEMLLSPPKAKVIAE